MFLSTFVVGFLGGCVAILLRPVFDALAKNINLPLPEDEKYLLCLARAASGRLVLRNDLATSGPPMIRLKEFPNLKALENKGQIERLQERGLIVPDGSGVPGRFLLSPRGWIRIKKVPALTLAPKQHSAWYNSDASIGARKRSIRR